jgi:integrase
MLAIRPTMCAKGNWVMVGEMPVERSAQAVADLLGHSSIAITGEVYGHTSNDTARAAIDGLAGRRGL